MRRTLIVATLICTLGAATIADTKGWFADTLAGQLINQVAIVAAGAAANLILPGSGASVMEALEAWQSLR